MRRLPGCLAIAIAIAVAILAAGCDEPAPPRVGGPARYEVRPTDGTGWQNNGYGDVTVEHWDPPGGHFRMHYTQEGVHAVPAADTDGSGVPDFVETFGTIFDTVYDKEVTALGLRPPLDDSIYHDSADFGGDGRFDVYLQDRANSSDGYIVVEACKPNIPYQCAGYMVVENDFKGYAYATPEDGMRVLSSHEFFHMVQRAHRSGLSLPFNEGSAVWATEYVFPEQDDFELFIPYFFESPQRSLDHELGSMTDLFPYAMAIWFTFLTERFGQDVLTAIFEELTETGSCTNDLDAIDVVLARDKQSSLAQAFAQFALYNLFTGNRAAGFDGYARASDYPPVPVTSVDQPLPTRISGEIAYLSAHYYQLQVAAGTWIRVTVEREQPLLAVHLVTWDGSTPRVESIGPDETELEIASGGKLVIIAASTARKDRYLPLSLAVREIPPPDGEEPPPNPPAPDGGVDADGDTDSDGGGCAVAPRAIGATGVALFLMLPFVMLIYRRRSIPPPLISLILCALLSLSACSDDSEPIDTPDAGADLAVQDSTTDLADAAVDLAPDGPVPLAVGQFEDFDADDNGVITGSSPSTGVEKYLLLLTSANPTPVKHFEYQTLEIQSTSGAPPSPLWPLDPRPVHHCRFHDWLEQIFQAKPTRWLDDSPILKATVPPQQGDTRTFEILSDTGGITTITAEALLVDDTAAYWLDTTTAPGVTLNPQMLQELADGFTNVIVPRERLYFGKESDVDGDGLIAVLFSPLVGESATAYVYPCDLITTGTLPGCTFSNQMELIYVSTPEKLPPYMASSKAMLELVAHEFQHAIYFYRKYVVNGIFQESENPYITEGLSALAQDLTGYQAGNLYVVMSGLEGIDSIAVPNVIDPAISNYVPQPEDGYMRGAGYLLLRYLFDASGGDELDADGTPLDRGGIAWLNAFVTSKDQGVVNVLATSSLIMDQLLDQFWTALALSNRGPNGAPINDDPLYNYLPTTIDPITGRQRGCNLFGALHMGQMTGPKTQPFDAADGILRAGGAEFLLLNAPQDASAVAFRVTTKPLAKARARLIRIK